jgi:SPP1 family predicted phage head-tail adaptor
MRIGEYRHRVTVQEVSVTRHASGAEIETWTTLCQPYMSFKPLTGKEYWAAQAENADVTHEGRMHYRSGISPKNQIVWGSRTFGIRAVMNVEERNMELLLLCEEIV